MIVAKYKDNEDITALLEVRADDRKWGILFIDEIWNDGYYFKNGFDIEEGMRVLDIGGHVGVFSILASKLGASQVVSFEPNLPTYEIAIRNIVRNKCDNILPVFGGVSCRTGRDTLHVPDMKEETNTGKAFMGEPFMLPEGEDKHYTEVPTMTFSMVDVIETFGKFDYLKLDCEGCEYPILQNTPPEIIKEFKIITMEFHGEVDKARELEKYLQSLGFKTQLDWSWGLQGRLQARK